MSFIQTAGECEFYHGLPRSTKSLRMVMEAILEHFGEGRELIANFHFKKVPYRYVRVDDLIDWITETVDDREYTLCIDEIQNEADGRDFASWSNKDFSKFCAQCGKRNIRIKYASQFGGGAELRLRQITDRIIFCTALRDITDRNQFTNLIGGVYEVWDKFRRKPLALYPLDREVLSYFWKFYNTRELILPQTTQYDYEADSKKQEDINATRQLELLTQKLNKLKSKAV